MPNPARIKLLLKKAAQDEYILDMLVEDHEAPAEIFGFHAQQAAEKLLKASLAAREIIYPQTHRLAELMDLIRSHGVDLPETFEELRYLTPFAVEFRYEVLPEEQEAPLDKSKVNRMIKELRLWVESVVNETAD